MSLCLRRFAQDDSTNEYARLVLDAINALGIYTLRAQDKWQIVDYTDLDPWQVDAGINAIDPDLLEKTLLGYRI